MLYEDIEKNIKDIVFQPAFADDDSSKKIGDIIPLSTVDVHLIKQEIQDQFGLTLTHNISDISVEELCKIVYEYINNHQEDN